MTLGVDEGYGILSSRHRRDKYIDLEKRTNAFTYSVITNESEAYARSLCDYKRILLEDEASRSNNENMLVAPSGSSHTRS